MSFCLLHFSPFPVQLFNHSITLTLLLTAMAFKWVLKEGTPNVPYLTVMEKYVVATYAMLMVRNKTTTIATAGTLVTTGTLTTGTLTAGNFLATFSRQQLFPDKQLFPNKQLFPETQLFPDNNSFLTTSSSGSFKEWCFGSSPTSINSVPARKKTCTVWIGCMAETPFGPATCRRRRWVEPGRCVLFFYFVWYMVVLLRSLSVSQHRCMGMNIDMSIDMNIGMNIDMNRHVSLEPSRLEEQLDV